MTRPAPPEFVMRRSSWLLFLVGAGFLVRAVGALAVDRVMAGRPGHDLFPDTEVYWYLAHAIQTGRPFSVPQPGGLHHALRTPGYPIFLALTQTLFGNSILPIRLIQAALGASTVAMAAGLVGQIREGRRVALLAAGLVAFEPYGAAMSVFLLSEAIFVPLMMLGLWGLAALWNDPARRWRGWIAVGTGLAMGAAILVKPSWALFPPIALATWLLASGRKPAAIGAAVMVAGIVVIMIPWWVRNAAIYGRFVPTALWAGASLYDGLNPRATGASDMEFLNRPPFCDLDEVRQDRALTDASLTFVRQQPRRACTLGLVKFLRYWSPWPNEASFRSTGAMIAGAVIEVPLFLLMTVGVWIVRRDVFALTVLAGPIVYFLLIHMVFVSSVRYRIPGSVPAMGLAAMGLEALIGRIRIRLL